MCTPSTCPELGVACGWVPDGCGDSVNCGACKADGTCPGGGRAGDCAPCVPRTCASAGLDCGASSDGCGGDPVRQLRPLRPVRRRRVRGHARVVACRRPARSSARTAGPSATSAGAWSSAASARRPPRASAGPARSPARRDPDPRRGVALPPGDTSRPPHHDEGTDVDPKKPPAGPPAGPPAADPRHGEETDVIDRPKTHTPRLYKVIFHNDDFTTQEFVVHVLLVFFHKTKHRGDAHHAHRAPEGGGGRRLYTRDVAETKVQQVIAFARERGMPLLLTAEPE